MIAFHGKPEIKDEYLSRVLGHRKADQLIKGRYWEGGQGCAVGCTIHSKNHANYESLLGIPRLLARLEDGIFEGLPNEQAMQWPERFLSAIPVGADLSTVWPQFAVWLLIDPQWGCVKFCHNERSKKAVEDVAAAYQSVIQKTSETPDWLSLRRAIDADDAATTAADDAAYYAATAAYYAATATAAAATDAAAYYAATAAAYYADAYYAATAAAATDDAAATAATTDDAAATRKKLRVAQSEKLIELLAGAPVQVAA